MFLLGIIWEGNSCILIRKSKVWEKSREKTIETPIFFLWLEILKTQSKVKVSHARSCTEGKATSQAFTSQINLLESSHQGCVPHPLKKMAPNMTIIQLPNIALQHIDIDQDREHTLRKINMLNLKITQLKRKIIFQTSMFGFQPFIFEGVKAINIKIFTSNFTAPQGSFCCTLAIDSQTLLIAVWWFELRFV